MTLKQDLKRLQEENRNSTSSTAPFQTLQSLDTIKTNLEKCVKVLQETGNWNGLVREMESYFAARNLGEVASRLTIMRQSLETLGNLPEASRRADIMERMEQRLEALVRPGLQNALEQAERGDFEPLKQSVVVFDKLGRKEALLADLGQSRGRLCFDVCWNPKAEEDDKHKFSRFLDRVLMHLREVELPLCKYAFSSNEDTCDALACIVRSCFQYVTRDLIFKLVAPPPKSPMTARSCEMYVLAHVAATRFVLDLSSSLLLHCRAVDMKESALRTISHPFIELDQQYQSWETQALLASLGSQLDALQSAGSSGDQDEDNLDGLLGPSGWELRMAKVKAEDVLETLAEECMGRCSQIKLKGIIPVCDMFDAHVKTCLMIVRESRKVGDAQRESGLVKACTRLKARFESIIKRHRQISSQQQIAPSEGSSSPSRSSPRINVPSSSDDQIDDLEKEAITRTTEAMKHLTSESKLKLFYAFTSPALNMLDKMLSSIANNMDASNSATGSILGPSEAITKAVDHLYSLIPQLEFELDSPDLIADPATLGKSERDELHSMLGGPIPYSSDSTQISNMVISEDPEEIARLISVSWLEAIGRAMCTAFVLRVLKLKKVSDKSAAQLGTDADCLEKNTGSVFAQGVLWDPALGVCRVVLSAGPGLTHLRLGNPLQHLDDRYFREPESIEPLKALEHELVALRNRS
jgi:hypothetical protein